MDENNKKTKKDDRPPLGERFKTRVKDTYAEFKKIIWPDKKTLIKHTANVIIVCAIIGAVIFVMDFVFTTGYDGFTNLFASETAEVTQDDPFDWSDFESQLLGNDNNHNEDYSYENGFTDDADIADDYDSSYENNENIIEDIVSDEEDEVAINGEEPYEE